MKKQNKIMGFTLVELMISVGILGILVMFAYPAYVNYFAQSYRADVLRELVRAVNRQEEFFADQLTYTDSMTNLGFSADPYTVDTGMYTIDVVVTESTDLTAEFLLRATASSQQLSNDENCKTISINHLGEKTATDVNNNDSTNDCWF